MATENKPAEKADKKVKVRLRVPSPGHKLGDVVSLEAAEAERLVANGTARRA